MARFMFFVGVMCTIAGTHGTYYNESVAEHWRAVCVLVFGILLFVCSFYASKLK